MHLRALRRKFAAAAAADIAAAADVTLEAAAGTSVVGFEAVADTMVSAIDTTGRGIITRPAIAAGSS